MLTLSKRLLVNDRNEPDGRKRTVKAELRTEGIKVSSWMLISGSRFTRHEETRRKNVHLTLVRSLLIARVIFQIFYFFNFPHFSSDFSSSRPNHFIMPYLDHGSGLGSVAASYLIPRLGLRKKRTVNGLMCVFGIDKNDGDKIHWKVALVV